MDQTGKMNAAEGADAGRWIGRIIIAVILGEALWGLIVSVMNNLVVPWLGDVMGQSSGLPTSFTQRPYNYAELFVSVFELCIAGLMAAILNYFFQRPRAARAKAVKNSVPAAPIGPVRIVPQSEAVAALAPPSPLPSSPPPSVPPPPASIRSQAPSPVDPQVRAGIPEPVTGFKPVMVPLEPLAPVTAAPTPAAVVGPAPTVSKPVSKPAPPAPKAAPAKPKKPKEVYYNIVGEPMPSDED